MFIIGVSSEEKMIRIHARRIIAGMANQHPVWDRAYKMLIGKPMCEPCLSFGKEPAVSVLQNVLIPNPTFIWFAFLKTFKKALFDCFEPLLITCCHNKRRTKSREVKPAKEGGNRASGALIDFSFFLTAVSKPCMYNNRSLEFIQ
jgi:hypothetical protein